MKKNVLAFIQNKNIFQLLSMLYSVNDSYENIFSNIIYTNKFDMVHTLSKFTQKIC